MATMKYKLSIGEIIFDILNYIGMALLVGATVYPLLHVTVASFSDPYLLMAHRGALLWPLGMNLASYEAVFRNPNIFSGYANTIFIVVVGTTMNLFMTALGGYFLSRKRAMWRNHVMFLIVFTMFFNGGLIPRYLLVRNLGMLDSLWALMIPKLISTYNMIILRTAMHRVPDSLEESAFIDGADHIRIMWQIILPLVTPTIAVLVLYYGVAHWNSWFDAMIYLRDRTKYPMQLILREILIENETDSMLAGGDVADEDSMAISETIKYAVIVIATAPILMLYPFIQRHFVKGIMLGALKG